MDPFWDATTTILSHLSSLNAQGISAYIFIAPSFQSVAGTINAFYGVFMLHLLSPTNTSASLTTAIQAVLDAAKKPFPPPTFFSSLRATTYPCFWEWYKDANGPLDAGSDVILGSRLLDSEALSPDGDGNATLLKETLKIVTRGNRPLGVYLVGGRGVWNAEPRGGSNAAHPAWIRALVHVREILGLLFPCFLVFFLKEKANGW
jgi:hypothetical protein